MPDYYDRQGQRLTLEQWATSRGPNIVALTQLHDVKVSTMWLGLDHNHTGTGPPLIFETMVFGGHYDQQWWRYTTEAQAVAGHDQTVAMVRDSLTP